MYIFLSEKAPSQDEDAFHKNYFNGGLPDCPHADVKGMSLPAPARRVKQRKRKHESAAPSPSPVVYDQYHNNTLPFGIFGHFQKSVMFFSRRTFILVSKTLRNFSPSHAVYVVKAQYLPDFAIFHTCYVPV